MSFAMAMGSHQSSVNITNEWITPKHIIDDLGPFDLDPCAARVMPWPTANEMWTHEGLNREWFGRVWLNPPYGPYVGQWLRKLADHANGIALIFARTETRPFFQHGWNRASAMLFLRGRLHFHKTTGERAKANAGAPSVLIAYGSECRQRLLNSKLPGKYVGLVTPDDERLAAASHYWR